jgi:hypothetical protein
MSKRLIAVFMIAVLVLSVSCMRPPEGPGTDIERTSMSTDATVPTEAATDPTAPTTDVTDVPTTPAETTPPAPEPTFHTSPETWRAWLEEQDRKDWQDLGGYFEVYNKPLCMAEAVGALLYSEQFRVYAPIATLDLGDREMISGEQLTTQNILDLINYLTSNTPYFMTLDQFYDSAQQATFKTYYISEIATDMKRGITHANRVIEEALGVLLAQSPDETIYTAKMPADLAEFNYYYMTTRIEENEDHDLRIFFHFKDLDYNDYGTATVYFKRNDDGETYAMQVFLLP